MQLKWADVWHYIDRYGPQAPRDITAAFGCHPESARKALIKLRDMGKLYRTPGHNWSVRYAIPSGCIPPVCMKGHALGSRRNLALSNERKRIRPKSFGECALAQCWQAPYPLAGRAD